MPLISVSSLAAPSSRPSGSDLSVGLSLTIGDGTTLPLRHGRGVLFARGTRADQYTLREARGLLDPSAFSLPDGGFGVVSRRVDPATRLTDGLVVSIYRSRGRFETIELEGPEHGVALSALAPALEVIGSGYRVSWTDGGVGHGLSLDTEWRSLGATVSTEARPADRSASISSAVAADLRNALGPIELGGATLAGMRRFPFITGRADPTIIHWHGRWIFIATDEHFEERRESSGLLLRTADSIELLATAEDHRILGPDDVLQGCFWAPELHIIGNRLWCLFAPSFGTTEWDGVQCWAMSVAPGADVTDASAWSKPAPVTAVDGGPLQLDAAHPGISLDMTYFRVDGRSYLVWSQRFTGPVIGDAELWIAETTEADPTRLISGATRIAVPEYSWEIDGTNVVEGPYAIVRDSTVYLTYSAAAVGPNYAVGLLTADAGADLLDADAWIKLPYPVLDTDVEEGEWGPGHSMFTRDEHGADLLVYHALPSDHQGLRHTGIRPVVFAEGGRLVLDARIDADMLEAL